MPFDTNKNLNFWSSKLGEIEAEKYSKLTNSITDKLATQYLTKIFLKWPEENLNIFGLMLNPHTPKFPELAHLYWTTISHFLVESDRHGKLTHRRCERSGAVRGERRIDQHIPDSATDW